MNKLILIALLFLAPIAANAQCADDSQCVKNTAIDRCAQIADEVVAARDVIAKFQSERQMTEAERTAAQTLIKGLNDFLVIKDRIITDYERINVLYEKVIQMQSAIIDKLSEQLGKGKSGWQKLASTVGKIVVLLAGIAIGRGGF